MCTAKAFADDTISQASENEHSVDPQESDVVETDILRPEVVYQSLVISTYQSRAGARDARKVETQEMGTLIT